MEPTSLPESQQAAFLDSPLYACFALAGRDEEALVKFFYGGGTLDAWCPQCEKLSVFKINSQMPNYNEPKKTLPYQGLITISAFCLRDSVDSYTGCRQPLYVVFHKIDIVVRKIGQTPSAADLAFGALDEAFKKELDDDRRKELGTAIGLHAHGVGIGSYVYLRRIFEGLLEEAHEQASATEGWDEPAYQKARVPDRIRLLKNFLPARLVKSANLYKALSLGVHELSEQECLTDFSLLKGSLEFILRERLEHKRYDEAIRAVNSKTSLST